MKKSSQAPRGKRERQIIAMIHVGALPGTPAAEQSIDQIVSQAVREAKLLARGGVDALLLENMHDVPYLNANVGPEVVASMTAVGVAVRSAVSLPLGIQILAAANREALAVALACGASFVRVENYAYAHVADEGLMSEASAGPLLRFRRAIGANAIRIFADIKKKHASHLITADVSIADAARACEFFRADGVVITGAETGMPATSADVSAVREAVRGRMRVLVGSGISPENLADYWADADGFIVGSSIKFDGRWQSPPDARRVAALVSAANRLRRG